MLIALTLLGAILGAAASLFVVPKYRATAKVYVSTDSAATITDLTQGTTFSEQVVAGLAEVATTPYVLSEVRSALGLPYTSRQLTTKITASAPTQTSVLEITASDSSPRRSARIADSVAYYLASAAHRLTPNTAGQAGAVKLTQIQSASADVELVSPNVLVNLVLGLLTGLIVAMVVGAAREALDTRVRSMNDVEHLTTRPILGAITYDAGARSRPLVVHDDAGSPRAEAHRALRTNLQFLDFDRGARVLVVTSAVPGEGKSTSAANLALALAETSKRVLLVDADLRRPALAKYLGLEGDTGLTDVLIGSATLNEAVQRWGSGGLYVLPAGRIPPNPTELLQSGGMRTLITQLESEYESVIFDAPPLLPVADAAILARRTSGAIVVSAVRTVRKPQLRAALATLERIDAQVLGIVVTMIPPRGPDAYVYGHYEYAHDARRRAGTPLEGSVDTDPKRADGAAT